MYLAFVAILLAAPLRLLAQNGTTSLRGTITDKNGASVPNALVTIESPNLGISLSTHTDRNGAYQFVEVKPATYIVTVTAAGFATIKQSNVQLLISNPTTDDLKLEVAAVATTIEVSGNAETINTSDATLGNAFNQTQIAGLPFEGRDPAGLLSLQPGVATVADPKIQQQNQSYDSRGGSVNGARSDQTNITLDGIDDNDQLEGYAFQGALRATLDSIEEFRVTTSNAGADQGRSSGGQVQLQTKSGQNHIHGTAYEYQRPTNLVANEYFNKLAELQNGDPNQAAFLLRNTFGSTFGGAIVKDRLFYFLAYEGQRQRENQQVTRTVPSAAYRDGVIEYQCGDPSMCPGTTVQGLSGASYTVGAGYNALSPAQFASMDPNCTGLGTCPQGAGVDPSVIKTLQSYPLPNSNQVGYGYNFQGYTFSSPTPLKQDTYIAKFDYNLTSNGTQRLFVRLGLQNDHSDGVEQFPGQPASEVDTNNTKGLVTGYTWTISPTKINNFHYGFIRQGVGDNGVSTEPVVTLRGLDTPTAYTRSTNVIVPVHNFTDDFTLIKGNHTLTFGGNYRRVDNIRSSNADSYSDALTNTGFLIPTGIANTGGSFDPAAFGFPAVSTDAANAYDYPAIALAGILTEEDNTYLQNKSGFLPAGSFIDRHFRTNEPEFYGMDSWRIKPNLTMTYGLRYSLLQPPYETNGNQVSPDISLNKFFQTRMADMVQGISYSPDFSFDLSGNANGKPSYWGWDYKDLAPRWSLAYSPGYQDGFLGSIFGGPGKSSIRMGAGIYYDHFGEGIANTFDRNGSFGFVTTGSQPPGTVSTDDAPRYTGINDLPASLAYPPPTQGFPVTPGDNFLIYWGLDDKLKTPYAYGFDLSYTRELKGGFTFQAAYVNRLGRRLLQERDLAQPLNLYDPKTGLSYFQAVTALAKIYRTGESVEQFAANPAVPANVKQYWTDILQPLQPGGAYNIAAIGGCMDASSPASTTNPLVAAYSLFCGGNYNETTPLAVWDLGGIPDANLPNVNYFPVNGPNSFYQSQFASLYAWSSIGRSNYNAGQFTLKHRATHGLTWDLNYTYSKSIDEGSNAERISLDEGFGFASQIINAFQPGQNRAVSDYDMTHQINSDWIYELPYGHGQKWGSSANGFMNAVLGGWTISGLYRWSSGLPFSVSNGFQFPTNWDLTGQAVLTGPKPATGVGTNCVQGTCNPNVFVGATGGAGTAVNSFDYPFPGESGSRNNIRGPGYFDIDAAMRKSWDITEQLKLAFGFDVYNLTNSVRFDVGSLTTAIDSGSSFGNYSQVLTGPRRIELSLRLTF